MTPNERGRRAIATLPKTFRIGAHDFAILQWTLLEATTNGRWGEFSGHEACIRIQSDMPSPTKAVDTFLHELLHAIYFTYGIRDDDNEERTVGHMATALTTAFRDNPWLAGWVARNLK